MVESWGVRPSNTLTSNISVPLNSSALHFKIQWYVPLSLVVFIYCPLFDVYASDFYEVCLPYFSTTPFQGLNSKKYKISGVWMTKPNLFATIFLNYILLPVYVPGWMNSSDLIIYTTDIISITNTSPKFEQHNNWSLSW